MSAGGWPYSTPHVVALRATLIAEADKEATNAE